MNPSPEMTLRDVAEAMQPVSSIMALRICSFARYYLGLGADASVSEAKSRAENEIERCRKKREAGHWSFDANKLIALKQFLRTLEAYEGRRIAA